MEEMINKLSSGIKMEFEVERMEPLFASQEEYDAFCKRHAQPLRQNRDRSKPIPVTAIWVSMPVPQRQKRPSSERTALCCTLFIPTTTAVR